jgi:hypothetical protein
LTARWSVGAGLGRRRKCTLRRRGFGEDGVEAAEKIGKSIKF